jgi:hypothetical protein
MTRDSAERRCPRGTRTVARIAATLAVVLPAACERGATECCLDIDPDWGAVVYGHVLDETGAVLSADVRGLPEAHDCQSAGVSEALLYLAVASTSRSAGGFNVRYLGSLLGPVSLCVDLEVRAEPGGPPVDTVAVGPLEFQWPVRDSTFVLIRLEGDSAVVIEGGGS